MSHSWVVNAPHVVAEIIDEELVIMNLETGTYYSSLGLGAPIWRWLSDGHSGDAIAQAIAARATASIETVQADVSAFIDHLAREALIRPADGDIATPGAIHADPFPRYEPATLNVYADMQDLMTLDPIHDVDTVGWPTVAPEKKTTVIAEEKQKV